MAAVELEVRPSAAPPEPPLPEMPPHGPEKKGAAARKARGAVCVVALLAAVAMVYFGYTTLNRHIENAYIEAKENAADAVYDKFYDTAFEYAEEKNHVSNRAVISIEDVTKLSRLEVLKVSDSEFVIENEDQNDSHITSWIEVRGTGVFTVDLQVAEFITDEQRQHVLVRVWKPELTNCSVDETGECFWHNDWKDDSVREGVELSMKQMSEGRQKIEDAIKQNRSFYDSALSAAESSIQSLVRSWNPMLPDLAVEVEFIDTPQSS